MSPPFPHIPMALVLRGARVLLRSVLFRMVLLVAASLPLRAAEKERPNILLIFADDLGWKEVGYQGGEIFETPHIDRLAGEGMVFTHAYAAAANCAPSRACLHSGNYTPRHEVYAVQSTQRGPKELMRLVPIPNKSGLGKDNTTVADALKAAGYATGLFGKWHLDGPEGSQPGEAGFDVDFDPRRGNPNASKGKTQEDPKAIFALTTAANEFMEAQSAAGKPFFAMVSHHAIHGQIEARPETLKHFQEKLGAGREKEALYAACTKDLDSGVGLLLEKLESLGIAGKTLVVFTSDNGGTGEVSQEPLRGSKGCLYEGGIREPFIVRWPGVTTAGTTSAVPVINLDLYPTFLAAANAPVPEGKTLDGESILPLLSGGTLKREAIFWHFPGYLDKRVARGRDPVFRTRPVTVIRKGDWKLHLYHEEWILDGGREKLAANNAVELYNLRDDPGEHHNLALTDTAQRDDLLDSLLSWMESVNARMATAPK